MEGNNDDLDNTDAVEIDFLPEYMESDRKRGIFTENDRKYLLNELEIDGQDERNIRYRIRQRLIQSFLDLQLLSKNYPDEELEKVMDSDDVAKRGVISSLVDIAYNISMSESRFTTEDFERILAKTIRRQQIKRIPVPESLEGLHDVGVDVEISVEEGELQDIVDSLVTEEADLDTWTAFARRVDVFDRVGAFDSDNTEIVSIQPPGADQYIAIIEPIATMIKRSEERMGK